MPSLITGEDLMDVRYINPFIASIKNVFSTMVQTEVTIGKPALRSDHDQSVDVSGVIGLSGDITGAVVLGFSSEVACKIASTFAGIDMTLDHPDFTDAIGELANMVAGNAKKDFTGHNVSISLPSVIVGAGHLVSQLKASPTLVIPCNSPAGSFNVEVALVVHKAPVAETEVATAGA